jgi:hypothetical protein
MRDPIPAALAAALLACAGARPHEADRCAAAADRVDALLAQGADEYVAAIQRYAATRDPGTATKEAAASARERAGAWTRANRPAIEAECASWPAERLACVARASAAADLAACGLERSVRSFTTEVIEPFAARPLDAPAR